MGGAIRRQAHQSLQARPPSQTRANRGPARGIQRAADILVKA